MRNIEYKKLLIYSGFLLLYIPSGLLCLQLAMVNDSATVVWAPTGIAIAALLYFGIDFWPAVLIGAFVVNIFTSHSLPASSLIAIGNTAEAVIGAFLTNRYASGTVFYKSSINVKKFVFFIVLATAISATVGAISLLINGLDSINHAAIIWFTWWVGDLVGALIITPLFLLLFNPHTRTLTKNQVLERVVFLLCVLVVSFVVFGQVFKHHPLGFLLIPLFVWPGLRFSQRESVISSFLIATIAIWATVSGMGPFIRSYPNDTLLMLQSYIAVISLTSLVLAAAVTERKEAQSKLTEAYDQALEGWARALDLRDKEIEGHARRVAELSVKLGERMGLKELDLVNIRRGALLHDIGKIALPDQILFKPAPLDEKEWEVMHKHPIYGVELLSHMSFFDEAKQIPDCHHEKWDGTGYPKHLKGEEIPLSARIFAIVDVWDAMRSDRPYRQALSFEETMKHLKKLSGTHFDPTIVQIFIDMIQNPNIAQNSAATVVQNTDIKTSPAL